MGGSEKTPLLKREDRVIEIDKDSTIDSKRPVTTDLEHGDAIKAQNVGFGRIMKLVSDELEQHFLPIDSIFFENIDHSHTRSRKPLCYT